MRVNATKHINAISFCKMSNNFVAMNGHDVRIIVKQIEYSESFIHRLIFANIMPTNSILVKGSFVHKNHSNNLMSMLFQTCLRWYRYPPVNSAF